MNQDALLYLIPYVISVAISAGVGLYAWHRRGLPGAGWFAALSLLQVITGLAYILELISPTLASKVLWDNVQFVEPTLGAVVFIAFVLDFVGQSVPRYRLALWLAAVPAVMFLVLVFTDAQHALVRTDARIVPGQPFGELTYTFTPAVYAMAGYGLLLFLPAAYILARRATAPSGSDRGQAASVLFGLALPVVGYLATLFGLQIGLHRDISPFTRALGNVVIAVGLFRHRLFDILPLAREMVVESMSDALVVVDMQDRIVDVNAAELEILGRTAGQVLGMPAATIFGAWPDLLKQVRGQMATEFESSAEREGQLRYSHVRVSPVMNRRGEMRGRVVVVRDITERRRAEDQLRERSARLDAANAQLETANAQLLELSRAKDDFVANVSHELRTPITAQYLCIQLLMDGTGDRATYLEGLKRETERLESMIDGLLTLSRLDQGHVRISEDWHSLNELVGSYVQDRTALAASRNLTLVSELSPDLPPAWFDWGLISQALGVLVTNALNYTPPQGRVTVRTHVEQTDGRSWVGLTVSDTGPGVPPAERPLLFTRFYRGAAGRNSRMPGTGLGLAIAREIVLRHAGRIELEPPDGEGAGATFAIWLPVDRGTTVDGPGHTA